MSNSTLKNKRNVCAKEVLKLYYNAHAGHIGASLSCLEILVDLIFKRMKPEDIIILSKGHAAAALYVTLAESGRLEKKELVSFYKDGTRLAAHPPCSGEIQSIPFGTGSLGHGLSLAAGIAFSQRFTKKKFNVFCVMSDGECDEGSTWEAALFAAHNKLENLMIVIDRNNLQGIGTTEDILTLEPLAEKWSSFGFNVVTAADGNSFSSLEEAHGSFLTKEMMLRPKCIIAKTQKGHGISYMQNKMEWHYLPMTKDQYELALQELEELNA